MRATPLVDIIMPTYNHERFIAQAIESVLAQKTAFEYRLIVGDDCSTDDTQAVVRSYAEKYPGKVEFFFSPVNVGALHRDRVVVKLLGQCQAKYTAILEGDDYWTDPYKLQKQVDFLETHTECSVSFHDALMSYEDGSKASGRMFPADQKKISTLEDIITTGNIPIPCTILFHTGLLGELPDCFYEVRNADWMIVVLLAKRGSLGYLDEVMAAYRVHAGGIWSGLNQVQRAREHIKTYETIDAHLSFKYSPIISEKISALRQALPQRYAQHARSCLDQYHALVKKGEITKGLELLWEATRSAPLEVFHPRRFIAVLKNGFLGLLHKSSAQN